MTNRLARAAGTLIPAALAAVIALAAAGVVTAWLIPAAVIALLGSLIETPLGNRLAPVVEAVRLPGARPPRGLGDRHRFAAAVLPVIVLLAVAAGIDLFGPHGWVPVAGIIALAAALIGYGWAAVGMFRAVTARRQGTADAQVREALTRYAPDFLIYYSGLVDGGYQLRMWLPYLQQTGHRAAILLRDHRMLPRAAQLATRAGAGEMPILSSPWLKGLDACFVPSVKAVFYVNTDRGCVDGVRYLDRTHVQLNHGDSDKPSSYHPMTAMFDQVFVAGRAAIDRFAAHRVEVPEHKFVIVGRPQMAGLLPSDSARSAAAGVATVLYAPTWRGGVDDMAFSSLARGAAVVQALLDHGVRVMFRPHPYSRRDHAGATAIARIDALLAAAPDPAPGLPHQGSATASAPDVVEIFNNSDALITDISSLATDYLGSGKPLAIVADQHGPQDYPVLRAAYRFDPDAAGDVLGDMLGEDPLRATRTELRSYYLGPEDPAAEFRAAASRAILGEPPV